MRSVSTSANSYVELWSWTDSYKEIIGLIDKTFLGVDIFNLKAMRLYDSILMLLDYNFGLHILRLSEARKFTLLGQI